MEDFFFDNSDYFRAKLFLFLILLILSFSIYHYYPKFLYLSLSLPLLFFIIYDGYRIFRCVCVSLINDDFLIDDGEQIKSTPLKKVKKIKASVSVFMTLGYTDANYSYYILTIELFDGRVFHSIVKCKAKYFISKKVEIKEIDLLIQQAKHESNVD